MDAAKQMITTRAAGILPKSSTPSHAVVMAARVICPSTPMLKKSPFMPITKASPLSRTGVIFSRVVPKLSFVPKLPRISWP